VFVIVILLVLQVVAALVEVHQHVIVIIRKLEIVLIVLSPAINTALKANRHRTIQYTKAAVAVTVAANAEHQPAPHLEAALPLPAAL
jgi:hypothetical protein